MIIVSPWRLMYLESSTSGVQASLRDTVVRVCQGMHLFSAVWAAKRSFCTELVTLGVGDGMEHWTFLGGRTIK